MYCSKRPTSQNFQAFLIKPNECTYMWELSNDVWYDALPWGALKLTQNVDVSSYL